MTDLPVSSPGFHLETAVTIACALSAEHLGFAGSHAFPGPAFHLLEIPGDTYLPLPAALPPKKEGLQRVGTLRLSPLELMASWKMGTYIEDSSFKPSIW